MQEFIKAIILRLIEKKKVIGWVGAAIIALGAAASQMDAKEFHDSFCGIESSK